MQFAICLLVYSFTRSQAPPGNAIQRLCLAWRSSEAEPLDIGSQAEPGNQLGNIRQNYCMNKIAQELAKSTA